MVHPFNVHVQNDTTKTTTTTCLGLDMVADDQSLFVRAQLLIDVLLQE